MNFDHPGYVLEVIKQRFNRHHILVIGDLMLDRQVFGDVSRISPEAPVPVLLFRSQTETMGGAGNVAQNLSRLGASVSMVALVGEDQGGEALQRAMLESGIDGSRVLRSPRRPTTVKTRMLGGHQHMLRVDIEQSNPLDAEDTYHLISAVESVVSRLKIDAIVLSDYNKGVLTPELCRTTIRLAKEYQVPVFVDPKGDDMDKYRGATTLTPNRSEFSSLCRLVGVGQMDFLAAAREVVGRLELEYLVVTRSEDGMILVGPNEVVEVTAAAREVFDVTGAGDTAVAIIALGVASGLSPKDALLLANGACGIVVGKIGTSLVELSELEGLVVGEWPVPSRLM